MTRDDIIKMAREAGAYYASVDEDTGEEFLALPEQAFELFAALVAAAEREECARVCEGMARPSDDEMMSDAQWIASTCARSIRARGET